MRTSQIAFLLGVKKGVCLSCKSHRVFLQWSYHRTLSSSLHQLDLKRRLVETLELQSAEEIEQSAVPRTNIEKTLDKEQLKYLRKLQAKYEIWRQLDPTVPRYITEVEWSRLSEADCDEAFLSLLRLTNRVQLKNESKRKLRQEFLKQFYQAQNAIAKGRSNLFVEVSLEALDKQLTMLACSRNVVAIRNNGSTATVVFDASFVHECPSHKRKIIFEDMLDAFQQNFSHKEPFVLHVTGLQESFSFPWQSEEFSSRQLALEYNYFVHFHSKNFLDLAPRQKMLYITFQEHNVMQLEEVATDKVFIIRPDWAYEPIHSLTQKGVTVCVIPFRRYILRSKSLGKTRMGLGTVLSVMLDMRCHGNWRRAMLTNMPPELLAEDGRLSAEYRDNFCMPKQSDFVEQQKEATRFKGFSRVVDHRAANRGSGKIIKDNLLY